MRLDQYLAAPTPQGQRNNALFAVTLQARESGWTEAEIRTHIRDKAIKDGLNEAEVDITIASAMARSISPREPWDRLIGRGIRKDGDILAWDAVISADSPPIPISPGLPPPAADWEHQDAIRFLDALFEDSDIIAYTTRLEGRGVYSRTKAEVVRELRKGATGQVIGAKPDTGAFVRLNPLDGDGVHDKNVVDYRHILVEADQMELVTQWNLLRTLKVPIATLTHSGNKSLHAAVKVNAHTLDEYQQRRKYLYDYLSDHGMRLDDKVGNPSRLSRLPGVWRGDRPQYLLATHLGAPSWDAWVADHAAEESGLPPFESWADLEDNLPPLAPEIITGILRRGHKMLLSGPSKAGKSYALIQLACAVCGGHTWLGHACIPGNVLYINLEIDRASMAHRVSWVKAHLQFAPKNRLTLWNLRGRVMELAKLRVHLLRMASLHTFDVIIIDPIYKANAGEENNARDMTILCNTVEAIAHDTGAAVVFAHHFAKGDAGARAAIDRASGSGVLGRDPDAIGTITALEGDDMDGYGFRLEWVLREFRSPDPVSLVFKWPLHIVDDSLADRRLKGSVGAPSKCTKSDIIKAYDIITDHTIDAFAKYFNCQVKTIRRHLEDCDSMVIKNGIIYRIK